MVDRDREANPERDATKGRGLDDGDRPTDHGRENDPLRRSRTSGAWTAVVLLVLVLLVLIIFVAQNTQSVQVSFLGWDGETPLATALLIATLGGLLLATIAGSLRIWQLRRRVRRPGH